VNSPDGYETFICTARYMWSSYIKTKNMKRAVVVALLLFIACLYLTAAAKDEKENDDDDEVSEKNGADEYGGHDDDDNGGGDEHDHDDHDDDHEDHDDDGGEDFYAELKEFIGDLESVNVNKRLPKALEKKVAYRNLMNKVQETMDEHKEEHDAAHDHGGDEEKWRVLISDPDGEVIMDTAKEDNSLDLYKDGAINENHADRQAIIDALESDDGFGQESKESKTTGNFEYYVAKRLVDADDGDTVVGVLRVSVALLGDE